MNHLQNIDFIFSFSVLNENKSWLLFDFIKIYNYQLWN